MKLFFVMATSFGIGFSGALMPGPLLGVTIDAGVKKGAIAGPVIAIGHGILEICTIALILLGLKEYLVNPSVTGMIGIIGGSVLFIIGMDMVRSVVKNKVSLDIKTEESEKHTIKKLVLAGIIVSVSNPYFTLWWATAGLACILDSLELGIIGVVAFYIGHILADITWFTFVAYMVSKGKKIMTDTTYKRLVLSLGIFICTISILFLRMGILTFL